MSEKKSYSVEEILKEANSLKNREPYIYTFGNGGKTSHSDKIVASTDETKQNKTECASDIISRVNKIIGNEGRENISREEKSTGTEISAFENVDSRQNNSAEISKNKIPEKQKRPAGDVEDSGSADKGENYSVRTRHNGEEPSDIKRKRVHFAEEIAESISPTKSENKIDIAVKEAFRSEQKSDDKRRKIKLTRTGVIRKADELIGENATIKPPAEMKNETEPVVSVPSPRQYNILSKKEKIVGDKEDIQTKAYNKYIEEKEQKHLDTGIIKTVSVKIPESSVEAHISDSVNAGKTIINAPANRNIILTDKNHTGNIEGQIKLEGFESDEIEKISEDELERQLDQNREKIINGFAFEKEYTKKRENTSELETYSDVSKTYAPPKETPVIDEIVDFNSAADSRAVYIELRELRKKYRRRMLASFLLEAVLAVTGILSLGIIPDFGMGTSNERMFIIINLSVLFLMSVICAPAIIKGFAALFSLKPSGDSMISVGLLFAFIQGITAVAFSEESMIAAHIYAPAAGLLLLLNCMGKDAMMGRIQKTFRSVSAKNKSKYSVAAVTVQSEAEEISRGVDLPDKDIRYNVPTEFATKFLVNSYAADPADDMAKKTAYIAFGASLITAVISYFITWDIMNALSVFTAAVLMSAPAANVLCFNKALEKADSELAKERGAICGFDAVSDATNTKAVIIKESDIFAENGCCVLKGMNVFRGFAVDDALIYAASILRETDCAVKKVFLQAVENVASYIPKTMDVAYEDRLGISGWIFDRKVLLGTAKMMEAHGVMIPPKVNYEERCRENQKVLFLSIDGTACAMFTLCYLADEEMKWEFQRLEAGCIHILVSTSDPNIDEEFLSYIFDMPENSMVVMSNRANQIYAEKTAKPVKNEAKLVNNGDAVTFMRQISACSILDSQFKFLKILQYVSMLIGFLITAVFGLAGSIDSIGSLHIMIYSAIWAAIVTAIPLIYKSVPKR